MVICDGGEGAQTNLHAESITEILILERSDMYKISNLSRSLHLTLPTKGIVWFLVSVQKFRKCNMNKINVTFVPSGQPFHDKSLSAFPVECGRLPTIASETVFLFADLLYENTVKLDRKTKGTRGESPTASIGLQTQSATQQHLARYNQTNHAKPTVNMKTEMVHDGRNRGLKLLVTIVRLLNEFSKSRDRNTEVPFRIPDHGEEYVSTRKELRVAFIKHLIGNEIKNEDSPDIKDLRGAILEYLGSFGMGVEGSSCEDIGELVSKLSGYFPESVSIRLTGAVGIHCDKLNPDPKVDFDETISYAFDLPISKYSGFPKLYSYMGGIADGEMAQCSLLLYGRRCVHNHALKIKEVRGWVASTATPLERMIYKVMYTVEGASNYNNIFECVGRLNNYFLDRILKASEGTKERLKKLREETGCERVWVCFPMMNKMVSTSFCVLVLKMMTMYHV